jgi:hypothetical protein
MKNKMMESILSEELEELEEELCTILAKHGAYLSIEEDSITGSNILLSSYDDRFIPLNLGNSIHPY